MPTKGTDPASSVEEAMSQVTTRIDEEAIRAKAYELWQLRGCPEGDPGDDWVRAERLLLEEAAEREQRGGGVMSAANVVLDDEATLPSGMPVPNLQVPEETAGKAPAKAPKRRGNRRR